MLSQEQGWTIPESITHLFYSPAYQTLSAAERRVYNRLHACYLCEMMVLYEESLPSYYLRAANHPGASHKLRVDVLSLAESEARHARMFRGLAMHLAPELYNPFRFHFVIVAQPALALLRFCTSHPSLFPAFFWIVMMQEERTVFYAEQILAAGELDPHVVDVHRRHLADEVAHLGVDEALIDLYWDQNAGAIRWLNGRLFRAFADEYLNAPKRGGLRLIERLLVECPRLQPERAALRSAMLGLIREPGFHRSLYSRAIVPRTFARFDRYREFHDLGKTLWGYERRPAQ